MEKEKRVICIDNESLASFMFKKRQQLDDPKSNSDRVDSTIYKAYTQVCNTKTPITTIKEFSQIKGVGKWTVRVMQDFFKNGSCDLETKQVSPKAKKAKIERRYVPQKNSVPYALLITLYREKEKGIEFMKKQELIDAAEASGLSRVPIAPETGSGKVGRNGASGKELYGGWTSMKTLITKGLVVKSSCPAKYMLSQEGLEAANDCLSRSGLADHAVGKVSSQDLVSASDMEFACTSSADKEVSILSVNLRSQGKSVDVPAELFERCRQTNGNIPLETSSSHAHKDVENASDYPCPGVPPRRSFILQPCSSDNLGHGTVKFIGLNTKASILMMPPLDAGEKFGEIYDVVLILDDREHFTRSKNGSRSKKFMESIETEFKIQIEVRRLEVGDGLWIAKHKYTGSEYVLDFIVERKHVDDLFSSIKDSRYRDQKLRLTGCGLQRLIYIVEGDPNSHEAGETIKTACFTTEILEGFDVQRTSGLGDTLRKYGYLTHAITNYYGAHITNDEMRNTRICPSYKDFLKKCQDIDKMTVSDVFAVQLMQVSQVTEEIALSVLELYPTLLSLARAYSLLEGDVRAQEEMLRKQSKNLITEAASKNIFSFVWGG